MATGLKNLTMTVPVWQGRLNPSHLQKLAMQGYLGALEGKAVVVRFSRPVRVRSNNQNRYMWGVVYELIATETGHTAEEIHAAAKQRFLPRKFIVLGGHEVEIEKSTTELSTLEFEHYLNQVRAWAATELGINIPLPNGELP